MTTRKHPPTNVHRLLNLLGEEESFRFREWAKWQSYPDIQRRLSDLRDDYLKDHPDDSEVPVCSYESCMNWYKQTFPAGDRAIEILGIVREYHGLRRDALTYAEMAIACTAANLDRVQKMLTQLDEAEAGLERVDPEVQARTMADMVKSRAALLYSAHNLAKELRTGAISLHEAQLQKETRELELAGGYRVLEIARTVAASTGYTAIIEEVLNAAIAQLEQEVNG